MTTQAKLTNSTVQAFVNAINNGDKAALMETLTPDAVLTDDGTMRDLNTWLDDEVFTVRGRITVLGEEGDGLRLRATFHNDTWGDLNTRWSFTLSGDKIRQVDTGSGVNA